MPITGAIPRGPRNTYSRKSYKSSASRKSLKPKVTPVQQVNRKVEAVKRTIKASEEKGWVDGYLSTTADVAGTCTLLNGLRKGDNSYNREGDEVLMRSVKFNFNTIAADSTNLMRVMLIIDHEPQGVTLTMGEVLDMVTITYPPYAFRKMDYKKRFTVLFDKSVRLNTVADLNQFFKVNQVLNLKTQFKTASDTGNISDISRNALYLCVGSDSAAVPNPGYSFGFRITYVR